MATKDHYLALDMLRGIAAYAVLLHHFLAWGIGGVPLVPLHGYLAVDFFFLLSGFVIAHAYEAKLSAGMGAARFMLVRLIRLYPMILVGLVLGVLHLRLAGSVVPLGDLGLAVAAHLFVLPVLLPNPISIATFPLNIPTWSLFFELAANLVHVLIAPRLSNRALIWIVLASFAAWLAVGLQRGLYGFTMDYGTFLPGWPLGFVRVAFPYFLGVLIFRLKTAGRLPRWSAHPFVLGALFLAAVFRPSTFGSALELFAVALVFPLILLLGANSRVEGWLVRPAKALGALSYPIYSVHVPLGLIVYAAMSRSSGGLPSPQLTIAAIALAVTTGAFVLLKAFDEPLRMRLGAYVARTGLAAAGKPLPWPVSAKK